MDFIPLRLNSSNLTCSVCALAAIILQLVAMECQKRHMMDSSIFRFSVRLLWCCHIYRLIIQDYRIMYDITRIQFDSLGSLIVFRLLNLTSSMRICI